jgi:hypothetical protein
LGQALTDLTRSEDPATAAARLARVEGHLDDPSYHLDVVDHALQSVGFALEKPGSPPALLLDDNTGQGWYRGKLAATLDPATLAWRLLRTIATRGDELNQESLYTEVWQAPYRPPSSRNTLYVSMHRLRTVARAAALDIDRTSEGGYRLRGGPAVWAWKGRPARSRTAAASTNIRASLDPFFGHHGLFNALSQELGPNTLLTLRGPPGCGKSRVARELALKMLEAGRIQEAWRCSLAGADGLLGILRAVAEPLGLPVAGMKSADSWAEPWPGAGRSCLCSTMPIAWWMSWERWHADG